MNQTIESILNHRSIRSYSDQPIEEKQLDAILQCAQAAPSSINGQQMSVIVIKNADTKQQLADLAGGQRWIAQAPIFLIFVADFYRAKLAADKAGEELVIPSNMEGTLVGSIDVGLAMGNTIAAAESLGLGTVCIGGIRKNPTALIELLDLPEYVYPMVGLCVGHINEEKKPEKKPRMPKEAVLHAETYNRELEEHISAYDKVIYDYMSSREDGQDPHDWSHFIASVYKFVYFPEVSESLRKQKFECK